MIRLTKSVIRQRGGRAATTCGRQFFANARFREISPTREYPENGAQVDRTACGSGPGVGGFVEMSLDTFAKMFRRPFQFKEFLDQTWMIARVSLVPTLLVAIPFTVLVAFTLNILLREIGAADLSGAGTAFGTITQLGPVVTVLVVAGAGATAICADLGARTIREEIDAMRVLGIDPIQRLVVPRVLASTFVALLLNGLVCAIGLAGGYVFSVFLQGVNPGSFINGLTVLTGLASWCSPRSRRCCSVSWPAWSGATAV